MNEAPARPGRKPIHGQAMSAAERKRAQREREARAQAKADAEAQAARDRQTQLAKDCQKAAGKVLRNLGPMYFYGKLGGMGYGEADAPECQAQIERIIQALSEGRCHIP